MSIFIEQAGWNCEGIGENTRYVILCKHVEYNVVVRDSLRKMVLRYFTKTNVSVELKNILVVHCSSPAAVSYMFHCRQVIRIIMQITTMFTLLYKFVKIGKNFCFSGWSKIEVMRRLGDIAACFAT